MEYPFNSNNLQGNIVINNIKDTGTRYGWNFALNDPNCKDINYKVCEKPDVMFGYNRPLNEVKPNIQGVLTYDPSTSCNSLWNNSTKRKIIVNN